HGTHIAAHGDVEETMNLALCMMKATCARPAIRAAEHRTGTVRVANARQLPAQQIKGPAPADRNEFTAAATLIGAGAGRKPATADRRLSNARAVPQGGGEVADDAVWIGIARIRSDFETGLAKTGREHAPVRGVWLETIRQIETGVGITNSIVH